MFDKFNFYDFLGYLLPGGAAIFLVYLVFKVDFDIPLPALPSDLSGSFAFLGASYIAGHLVQAVGSRFEDWIDRSKDKPHERIRLGERLLVVSGPNELIEPDGLSKEVREKVKAAAQDVFSTQSESDIFDLCQELIADKSVAQRTEIYTAQRGLARGMLTATSLGIALLAIGTVYQLIRGEVWEATVSAIVILDFIAIALLFGRGFMRFREYFAKSVYWAFLAWHAEQLFDGRRHQSRNTAVESQDLAKT